MIDKLIESLKEQLAQVRSKLPGGGDDDYEDETDVDITTSGLDVTNATGRKSRKSFDEDDEYEDDEDVDDASAKKSKYIRIFVIVGLTYYGITEFVVKEEPQAPAKVVKKKVVKKKVVQDKTTRKKVKEKPRAVKKASAVADKSTKVESDKYPRIEKEKNEIDVKEPSKNNQLSNDNNQDTDKFDEVDKSSDTVVSDPMVTDISESENQNTEMNTTSDNSGVDSDFTDMMNQIESEVEDKDATESMQDQLNKIVEKVSEKKENPVQEVDYVEAPDYEKFGRGLVYNCKEGHWACVDKESWFQCRQNDYWTKQNKKPKECVISDVYSSISDCRIMQLENINKVLKPECN